MPWLRPLSQAYHHVYSNQSELSEGGRDWVGSRDYYALIKLLRLELGHSGRELTPSLLAYALCRNFGGQPRLTRHVLGTFADQLAGAWFAGTAESKREAFTHVALWPVLKLIDANLKADSLTTRHLMLCTQNAAAVGLLRAAGMLNDSRTDVLFSSHFADESELTIIRQVNQVKTAMALGRTVVLVNHDNLYEALYDVLNQRYVLRAGSRLLRIAIGARSQLCAVVKGFKLILLTAADLLSAQQLQLCTQLEAWAAGVCAASGAASMQAVFCGYHLATIASAVMATTGCVGSGEPDLPDEGTVEWIALRARVCAVLVRTLLPLGARVVALSEPAVNAALASVYFEIHADLNSALQKYDPPPSAGLVDDTIMAAASESEGAALLAAFKTSVALDVAPLLLLLTRSPASHLSEPALLDGVAGARTVTLLPLATVPSEEALSETARAYYQAGAHGPAAGGEDPARRPLLVVQADPLSERTRALLPLTMHVLQKERARALANVAEGASLPTVMLVLHLPPGHRSAQRSFSLDLVRPWRVLTLDDVRAEGEDDEEAAADVLDAGVAAAKPMSSLSTSMLLEHSPLQLVSDLGKGALVVLAKRRLQSVLSLALPPQATLGANVDDGFDGLGAVGGSEGGAQSIAMRVAQIRRLLAQRPRLGALLERGIRAVLARAEHSRKPGSVHAHVALALADTHGGSLRQALRASLVQLVVAAAAATLRALDADGNLLLLDGATEMDEALWFGMAAVALEGAADAGSDGGESAKLAALEKSIGSSDGSAPDHCDSHGRHGVLRGRFPFAHRIAARLRSPFVAEQLRALLHPLHGVWPHDADVDGDADSATGASVTADGSAAQLELALARASALGRQLYGRQLEETPNEGGSTLDEHGEGAALPVRVPIPLVRGAVGRYVHDCVLMSAMPLPALSADDAVHLHVAILRAAAPAAGAFGSPATALLSAALARAPSAVATSVAAGVRAAIDEAAATGCGVRAIDCATVGFVSRMFIGAFEAATDGGLLQREWLRAWEVALWGIDLHASSLLAHAAEPAGAPVVGTGMAAPSAHERAGLEEGVARGLEGASRAWAHAKALRAFVSIALRAEEPLVASAGARLRGLSSACASAVESGLSC
ncbi:hypothetical protein T492DRAFT_886545 [Pavlovales sp. CCMP2436]|nr:hypothetical protein T492DRAFT_886545 [Pavlovales sp. CCMP2436]